MKKGKIFGALTFLLAIHSASFAQSELDTEIKTMLDIAKTYADAWGMNDLDKFLVVVRERDEKLKYCSSVYQKYKDDIDKKTPTGELVKQKMGWVKSQFTLFFSQAQTFADNYKTRTQKNFELYDSRMVDAKKSNSWPLMEGAKRALDDNEQFAKILQAFNGDADPNATEVLTKVGTLKKECDALIAATKKATERKVTMPVEKYAGADKEKYRSAIKKEWQAQWPSDKILKIVFPSDWTRKDEWNHNGNGNYSHTDMSYLVAWVIVQIDSQKAMMYPAYVNKNNLSKAISYGVQTKGGSYVNDEIPLSKVK